MRTTSLAARLAAVGAALGATRPRLVQQFTTVRAIAARFDELLRQRIAAEPERAACRWHVVVLDITRL